jgi:hypothetical protein
MTSNIPTTETNGTAPAAVMTAAEFFAQFQAATQQFFAMQQSQHQLAERFLEVQERVLLTCLQGAPVSAPPAVAAAPARIRTQPVVQRTPVVPATNGHSNGHANGHSNGHTNGHANGHSNGQAPRTSVPAATPLRTPPVIAKATAPAAPAAPAPAPRVAAESTKVQAPAPAPTQASAPAGAAIPPPPPTEQFRRDLLQIVSDRTGYPIDMLDENLPLESGLGIDSIKTVEIFSKLKNYHVYSRETAKDMDEEEVLAGFTRLKTLKDVVDSYDTTRQAYLQLQGAAPAAAAPAEKSIVDRHAVTTVPAPQEAGVKKNSLTATSPSSLAKVGQ